MVTVRGRCFQPEEVRSHANNLIQEVIPRDVEGIPGIIMKFIGESSARKTRYSREDSLVGLGGPYALLCGQVEGTVGVQLLLEFSHVSTILLQELLEIWPLQEGRFCPRKRKPRNLCKHQGMEYREVPSSL